MVPAWDIDNNVQFYHYYEMLTVPHSNRVSQSHLLGNSSGQQME